ncbi:MAG: amino acid adenylation domain-containing protein [Gammaproteobacteria bacterium]
MPTLIHEWLGLHARRAPDREAVRFADESLSYAELHATACQLAHCLIDAGVKPGDRVGIFMDKRLYTPVAMYGIMMAGAAYVPLDPSARATRLAGLLRDADIRIAISDKGKRRTLRALTEHEHPLGTLVGLNLADTDFAFIGPEQVSAAPATAPEIKIDADALAYIIYTSGSTGTPKGIMHNHQSGLAFATWAAAEYELAESDRLSNHAPLHFDLSIFDYFAGLVAGACTVIIPEEYTKLPASYAELIHAERISVLFTVPFALIQLLHLGAIERFSFDALRWVIFGGEAFAPIHLTALMARWPQVRFDNMYGPAEVNGVTHYTVPEDHDPATAVSIGHVAHTARGMIMDPSGAPTAQGQTGELWIASPTMMMGYWQRDDLNARVFVNVSQDDGTFTRYFRTGDVVSQNHDGRLHFAGRMDRQVKIRGYRVELDEVELALTGLDDVLEGAAFALSDDQGANEIRAQVTLQEAANADVAVLTRALRERLPWYAMPAALDIIADFPRTTSGKIDRRALAEQTQFTP